MRARSVFILLLLVGFSLSVRGDDSKKSGEWSDIKSDIKSGVRKIVRGGAKAVKKGADKVQKKIDKKEKD